MILPPSHLRPPILLLLLLILKTFKPTTLNGFPLPGVSEGLLSQLFPGTSVPLCSVMHTLSCSHPSVSFAGSSSCSSTQSYMFSKHLHSLSFPTIRVSSTPYVDPSIIMQTTLKASSLAQLRSQFVFNFLLWSGGGR